MNIFKEFRIQIVAILKDLKGDAKLPEGTLLESIIVEPPRDRLHGELATNAAMVVAKQAKKNPIALAELIANMLALDSRIESIKVV